MIRLHEGDNRIILRRLIDQGVRVHSIVTDPPYGYVSMTKRFGKEGSAPARVEGNDGSFSRLSTPWMGHKWDATGIERDPEFWRLAYDILLPGGYVVAFSSPRTFHYMAIAIEEAGFVTHPLIGWISSQGFPKAHDAAKAIDKHLGKKGSIIPQGDPVKRMIPGADQHRTGSWIKDNGRDYQPGEYVPATEEAAEWQGWKYGGQARKPALEPIYVGQKPFSEKSGAANILKHGVGAVNIDGCRVPSEGGSHRHGEDSQQRRYTDSGVINFAAKPGPRGGDPKGRYPANLCHDGSPEVVELFPESKGQQGDVRGTEKSHTGDENTHCYGEFGRVGFAKRSDTSGSAARFFETYPFDGTPIIYHPKAGKTDRAGSSHSTVKPVGLMRALVRHITPPGGTVLDPFAGSGTTGVAALAEGMDCILIEQEPAYAADIRRRFFPVDDRVAEAYLRALMPDEELI